MGRPNFSELGVTPPINSRRDSLSLKSQIIRTIAGPLIAAGLTATAIGLAERSGLVNVSPTPPSPEEHTQTNGFGTNTAIDQRTIPQGSIIVGSYETGQSSGAVHSPELGKTPNR